MKRNQQKGFTLLELVVTLTIIALLLATTIPGMIKTSMNRAKVAEAVSLMTAAKAPIIVFYLETGEFPATAESIGIKSEGKYTLDITLDDLNKTVIAETLIGNIGLHYNETNEEWQCFTSNIHGMTNGLKSIYAPSQCRN